MNFRKTGITICICTLFSSISYADNKVPYPENYRNWSHVKTMIIEPGHPLADPFQGIHHVYGNKKAIKGLTEGVYLDGAVLVFDLLNYQNKDMTITEGDRKLLGIMHKDSKKYAKTGGWGFEGFAENSQTKRLTNDGGTSCFSCHAPQEKDDYVFTKPRN
ncbi:MAG: cytochrome P460 family protein [Bacteroidota bacterium]